MPVRVIFVTTVFDDVQNGPGLYAQYLWRAFRDDPEIEFHVVAPSCQEQHPRLHAVGTRKGSLDLYDLVQNKAIELAMSREKDTIIHGNMAHAMSRFVDYPGRWYAQINDYEVACLWKNVAPIFFRAGLRRILALSWRRQQEKKVVKTATKLICNSHYTRKMIESTYSANPARCITIHKAVDTSQFQKPDNYSDTATTSKSEGPHLTFVGSNWQIKGLDTLLKALPRILKVFPHTTLTIGGPIQHNANEQFTKLAAKLNILDHVVFPGRIERNDLPKLLWGSDIFVLPSRQEAFGVAVIEAMAAGLPVVGTNIGGIPEIISSDTYGRLCPPDNPKALAWSICELVSDKAERTRLSEIGPARAADFDTDTMIKHVRNLYLHDSVSTAS